MDFTVPTEELTAKLDTCAWWDKYTARTQAYGTPHKQISDIWVRYNHIDNLTDLATFNEVHKSVWYPVADEIPDLKETVHSVLRNLGGRFSLGGVLITRIPPGAGVAPHHDKGWHAQYYYDKYIVQLKGNLLQGFHFEDYTVRALPGQVYYFDNSQTHWVTNDSEEDRMSLIICVRPLGE